jgi:hypothetical protein
MLRTRFATKDLTELVHLMVEFEEKLTMWSEKNITATWDVRILIGEGEYIIEVTVEDDEDKKTK